MFKWFLKVNISLEKEIYSYRINKSKKHQLMICV